MGSPPDGGVEVGMAGPLVGAITGGSIITEGSPVPPGEAGAAGSAAGREETLLLEQAVIVTITINKTENRCIRFLLV